MASVMSVSAPEGRNTRSCGSQCHNAKHTECSCICGGVNHGVGLNEAIDNTRLLMETFQTRHPEIRFPAIVYQLRLRDIEEAGGMKQETSDGSVGHD